MKKQTISKTKLGLSGLLMLGFVIMIVYADTFGSFSSKQDLAVNPIFVGGEERSYGINPDNISLAQDDDRDAPVISYIVQEGDNLNTISKDFGVTVEELKKINKLSGEPSLGQKLIVTTDEEGVLYIVEKPWTLKLFSEFYGLNIEDLMILNYISDKSEMLFPGQEIFINITEQRAYDVGLFEKAQPVLPKDVVAVKKTTITKTTNTQASNKTNNTSTSQIQQTTTTNKKADIEKQRYFNPKVSNTFAPGNCTWYAAYKSPWMFQDGQRLFGGNAKDRYANAQSQKAKDAGIKTSKSTPVVGGIIVYGPLTSYAGHVGIVIAYYPDSGKILVEDMNYSGKYVVTQRRDSVSNAKIIGYIYH